MTAFIFHGFLGPDPWLVSSRGSWVQIPGCFTFFTALSARVFIKQLSTSHSESRLPNHGWIQLKFDACDVTGFRNTHRPLVRIENTISHAQPGCLLLCRCTESVALPTVLMTSDVDSSIPRELRRNSSRHTHVLSGTLDVTPFLHGSDFTLLADTSLTHSFHTQSPMSVHATCLHLVRRTQALRPLVSHTKLNLNASFTIADVVSTALRTRDSATSRHTPRRLLLPGDSWPAFQLCKPCATCAT